MRFVFLILSFLFSAPLVYAGEGQERILRIIGRISDFLATLFLTVSVVMFLYAGYVYWQAGGKPEAIAKAHQNLLWAVIGTAVGLLAFAAPGIIIGFLG